MSELIGNASDLERDLLALQDQRARAQAPEDRSMLSAAYRERWRAWMRVRGKEVRRVG
jgi:hypothetical protein